MAATPPGGGTPPREPAGGKGDKAPRAPNFSEAETDEIIAYMGDHEATLTSRNTSQASRAALWCELQQQVNALGVHSRTVPELKKKWQDIKRRAKERLATRQREALATGGGPETPVELTPQEEAAIQLIHPLSVHGIGGLDTAAMPGAVAEQPCRSPSSGDDDGPPPLEGEEGDPDLSPNPTATPSHSPPAAGVGDTAATQGTISPAPPRPHRPSGTRPRVATERRGTAPDASQRGTTPRRPVRNTPQQPGPPLAPRALRNAQHTAWEVRMEAHHLQTRATLTGIRRTLRCGTRSINNTIKHELRAMTAANIASSRARGEEASQRDRARAAEVAEDRRARAAEAAEDRRARATEHANMMAAIAGVTSVLALWVSGQRPADVGPSDVPGGGVEPPLGGSPASEVSPGGSPAGLEPSMGPLDMSTHGRAPAVPTSMDSPPPAARTVPVLEGPVAVAAPGGVRTPTPGLAAPPPPATAAVALAVAPAVASGGLVPPPAAAHVARQPAAPRRSSRLQRQ